MGKGEALPLALALLLIIPCFQAIADVQVLSYATDDVSIMAPEELADKNFADDPYLVAGYRYEEKKYCSNQGCLIQVENRPAYMLLRFKVPDYDEKPSKVVLILPLLYMEYDLPENNFQKLCRFSVAWLEDEFKEDEVTWEEIDGKPWSPEDEVTEFASFYITPETKSPLYLDLTDELKDLPPNTFIYLAIIPSPYWWDYTWEDGMGCSLFTSSSEGGAAPAIYYEFGEEQEVNVPFIVPNVPVPKMPFLEDEEPDVTFPQVIKPVPVPILPIPSPDQEESGKVEDVPTFSIQVEPQLASVYPGEEATYKVYVISHFSYNKPVALKVLGVPDGSSVTITPSKVFPLGPSPKFLVNIKVQGDTPSSNYLITFKGEGPDLVHEVTAWLQVKPKVVTATPTTTTVTTTTTKTSTQLTPKGDFYIKAPEKVVGRIGRAITVPIIVEGVGEFNEQVYLSATQLPGALMLISDNPISPNQKTYLRFLPTEKTPVGEHKLLVVGYSSDNVRATEIKVKIEPGTSTGYTESAEIKGSISLIIGETKLETWINRPVRTWLTVKGVRKAKLTVEAPEEVKVDCPEDLSYDERSLIYLESSEPGKYEVRLRVESDGLVDEKLIELEVKGETSGGKTSVQTGSDKVTVERTVTTTETITEDKSSTDWTIPVIGLLLIIVAMLAFLLVRRKEEREVEGEQPPS